MYDIDALRIIGAKALKTCTNFLDPRYIDNFSFKLAHRGLSDLKYKVSQEDKLLTNQAKFPGTESLKQCQVRAYGYWKDVIAPRVLSGERVLIVAHANTIRALVKAIDNIDDAKIAHLKIPNGVPLVYTLDENLKPVEELSEHQSYLQAKYLVSVRNHGKVKNNSIQINYLNNLFLILKVLIMLISR
jgi:bisphosphoglycerate-dependent phosphoglycerate mutase family 1